jgi:hypothetical protein
MLQSRRGFLIGAGAVLTTAFRGEVDMLNADAALLAELTPRERSIVQQAMDNCPGATLAKILAELKAAGM